MTTLAALAARARIPSLFSALCVAVCAIVVAAILYPLGMVAIDAFGFSGGESVAREAYAAATGTRGLATLRSTVLIVLPAAAGALTVGALLAWLNERTDARLGWLAEIMPVLPMFVPPIAGAIGWVFLAAPTAGLLNVWIAGAGRAVGIQLGPTVDIFTPAGLIAVYMLYLTPYAYVSLAAGFRSIDSATEEAARISGAGSWQTLLRVTLPSLGPSIGGALLIIVAMGFALFSLPVVIGTSARVDILSVEIVHAMTRSFPADLATALGYSGLLVLLVGGAWILQRRLSTGIGFATIGGRGNALQLTQLGPFKVIARLVMIGYLCLTSVLPVFALLVVSLQHYWEPRIAISSMTISNYTAIFGRATVAASLRNSAMIGVVVATVGMGVAAIISYTVLQRRSRFSAAVDGVTKLPAAIPNIVTAMAFVIAFAGPPFRLGGSFLLLALAYVVVYLPQASVNATAAYLQIGTQLREAASVSGASDGGSFRRILLPLMLPGLAAGWAFLFVLIAGDVNVASLVAGTRTPVAGFVMLDLFSNGTYPPLAALSVVMTGISTVIVSTALWYTRRRALRAGG